MLYLDSNIFIYAAIDNGGMGEKARTLLRKVQQGEEEASSSALTFDELVLAVKKYRSMDDAINVGEAFLNFPNIKIVAVDDELLVQALNIIKKYKLDPRDAIHAATAILKKAEAIVTTDPQFDKVKEIKRKPLK
ncbi:MAG: type II toxin-antitoxin system VapC family toxin [Candidatus Bathyarchaeia archaeon]